MSRREVTTQRVITEYIQTAGEGFPSIAGLNATVAELNYAADLSAQAAMAPAAGFLGTGTVYKSAVTREGEFIKTQIYIDLTGAKSVATDLDIIGLSGASHIGQVTAAVNGTIVGGTMTCLEVPTTGADDIDLYAATVGTGAYDGGIEALTETALITAGEAWALGATKGFSGLPAADTYLYLTSGEAAAGTYNAGKLLITLWGV